MIQTTADTWTSEELRGITAADDLHIAPLREDGVTYGTSTWIWSVVVDDAFVCSREGNRAWYQAAMRQKAGRSTVAGSTDDVDFEPVDGPINARIDNAYGVKYQASPYIEDMISDRACAATVKVVKHR